MVKNNVSLPGQLAIFSVAFVAMALTATTPAMAALAAQFPDAGQNISLLSNGYIFTCVPLTLLSGWLTGNGKLKFRTATFVGSILLFLGGVGPAIIHDSFITLLIFKLIFGIGLGLLTPLANALILNLYEGNPQAQRIGWAGMLGNIGGIFFQMFGGILVDSNGPDGWFMHFWAYALCAVPILLAFFIPEPEKTPEPMNSDGSAAAKAPIGSFAFIAGIFLFVLNVLNFPVMMYMTSIFIERGIGGEMAATTAATALSLFTVAGAIAGGLYGTIFKFVKRFTLPAGYFIMTLGAFFLLIAQDVVVACAGTMSLGFGMSLVMPSYMVLLGMKTSPSRVAIATSIVLSIMNIGALGATPYLQLLEGIFGAGLPLYNGMLSIEIAVFAATGLLLIFWNLYPKAPPAAPAPEAPAPTEAE